MRIVSRTGIGKNPTAGNYLDVGGASNFDGVVVLGANLITKTGVSLEAQSGTFAIGSDVSTTTINIGTAAHAKNITIGGVNDTVTIQGTVTIVDYNTFTVSDKLITLNKGGAASSAFDSGIELEENSSITAYFRTSSDRTGWSVKSPANSGTITLRPSAAAQSLTIASGATAAIVWTVSAGNSDTFAGLTSIQTLTNKTLSGNTISGTTTVTGTVNNSATNNNSAINNFTNTLNVSGASGSLIVALASTATFNGVATFNNNAIFNGIVTLAAQIRTIDGTGASPAYSFTSNTAVGMLLSGSSLVWSAPGFNSKLALDSSRLIVASTSSGHGFSVESGGTHYASLTRSSSAGRLASAGGIEIVPDGATPTGGTPRIVVRTSGASGFGAQTLSSLDRGTLNVSQSVGITGLSVGNLSAPTDSATSGAAEFISTRSDGNTTWGGRLGLAHWQTSGFSGTGILDGRRIGVVTFGAMAGNQGSFSAANLVYSASINAYTTEQWVSTATTGTELRFNVNSHGAPGRLFDAVNVPFGDTQVLVLRATETLHTVNESYFGGQGGASTFRLSNAPSVGSIYLDGTLVFDTSTSASRLWRNTQYFGTGNGLGPIVTMNMNDGGDINFEIGDNRTANGSTYIDLKSTTGSPDADLRIIRYAGTNGNFSIENNGSGTFQLAANGTVRADFNNSFTDFYKAAGFTSTVIRLNGNGSGNHGVFDRLAGANGAFNIKNEGSGSLTLFQNNQSRFSLDNDIIRVTAGPVAPSGDAIIDIQANAGALRLQKNGANTDGLIAVNSSGSSRTFIERAAIRGSGSMTYMSMANVGVADVLVTPSSTFTYSAPISSLQSVGIGVMVTYTIGSPAGNPYTSAGTGNAGDLIILFGAGNSVNVVNNSGSNIFIRNLGIFWRNT